MISRPRRNRRSPAVRGLVRETRLTAENFVLPLFIVDSDEAENFREPIPSMPGCCRHSLGSMVEEARGASKEGILAVAIFPKVKNALKTPCGKESANSDGLVARAVRLLKAQVPGILVICDVALDPYSSDGHDGIVVDGIVQNDATVEALCMQALCHAQSGADIVAPSDMMDGRVGAIRAALDGAGFDNVSILSYTAKYASALYGPFRDALDSAPRAAAAAAAAAAPAVGGAVAAAGRSSAVTAGAVS